MARTVSFPRRGSVYYIAFDPALAHEVRKARPAVVSSIDHMNELAATIHVMPITAGLDSYYHWIPLRPPEGGVKKPSSIFTDQIRAVEKRRIKRRLGTVTAQNMTQIENAVRDHCGLPEGRVLP